MKYLKIIILSVISICYLIGAWFIPFGWWTYITGGVGGILGYTIAKEMGKLFNKHKSND